MLIKTKCFGEVDIAEDKIIHFEHGLLGFDEFKDYTILFDSEKDASAAKTIMWLQSMEEPAFALPVVDPFILSESYDPVVEDELLSSIGKVSEEDLLILVTLTVPSDLTKMTANFKAPIIINAGSLKGVQMIAENEDYLVKQPIYDILKARKAGE
ncbi:MAG: flagellar assembly protein FliW [Lachnospiraceae bacterium]